VNDNFKQITRSPIVQAFLAAAAALFILKIFEEGDFDFMMQRGGGQTIAVTVFIGVLAYRLFRDYLSGTTGK
jgi:hypothetical protein